MVRSVTAHDPNLNLRADRRRTRLPHLNHRPDHLPPLIRKITGVLYLVMLHGYSPARLADHQAEIAPASRKRARTIH